MADPLKKQVLNELKTGKTKGQILKNLETADNRDDLAWYLNHFPSARDRRRNLLPNWLLIIVLLTLTVKKLYFIAMVQLNAAAVHQFSPLLLADLIVPVVNFYVLGKIVHFDRQGYQFMTVLGILALVREDNRVMPDLSMYLVIIGLSLFLLLRLFPKSERIQE